MQNKIPFKAHIRGIPAHDVVLEEIVACESPRQCRSYYSAPLGAAQGVFDGQDPIEDNSGAHWLKEEAKEAEKAKK